MNRMLRSGRLLMLMTAWLTACSDSTALERLAAAQDYINQLDRSSAKLVLHKLPGTQASFCAARPLLGQHLEQTGDAPDAKGEFKRALRSGHPPDSVLLPRADQMLVKQKARPFAPGFDRVELTNAETSASLLAQSTSARSALEALATAARIKPEAVRPQVAPTRRHPANRDSHAAAAGHPVKVKPMPNGAFAVVNQKAAELAGIVSPGQVAADGLRKLASIVLVAQAQPARAPTRHAAQRWRATTSKLAMPLAAFAGVLALFVLLLPALRLPKFSVKRSITIAAPPHRVFELLQDLRQWETWSQWGPFAPTMTRRHTRTGPGQGALCEWRDKSKRSAGAVEIMHAQAPSLMAVEVSWSKPELKHQMSEFQLGADAAGGTLVSWTSRGLAPYRMRLAGTLRGGLDRHIGRQLQAALQGLKRSAEAAPALPAGPAPSVTLAAR